METEKDGVDLFLSVRSIDMENSNYSVIVQLYLFGQFRIQITDIKTPDPLAPPGHGSIVREMCTYNPLTCAETVFNIKNAKDPEKFAESLANEKNCEHPGGRIRLDNKL